MEKAIKMLAICILIGCLLISGALFYNQYTKLNQSRYYFSRVTYGTPMVFDNLTGKYYYSIFEDGIDKYYEVDSLNGTKIPIRH